MSYLYDTVEPSVISDDMLMQAVIAQGPVEEAGRVAQEEGLEFKDVTSLQLDFINIIRIDGLWEFVNLTKLQMDNNIIERIEGIENLVNLVWLDLSFNNIEVIEGLNTLTKLQDLTLFNNHITRIENMDTLRNLQIFSIGNNDLRDLENIIYLRKFKHLRSLNLSNNPFYHYSEYKLYVAAYLPNLDFLDYRLLSEQTKTAAYEKYPLAIDTMNDEDRLKDAKEEEEKKAARLFEYHKKAFVENLDACQLYDALYEHDTEGRLLNAMPDIGDALKIFKEKFTQSCNKIFEFGLAEYQKREDEIAMFWECVEEAKQENKKEGQKALEAFQAEKKKIFAELLVTTEGKVVHGIVIKYNHRVTELWDKLMGLEMQLLEQLEDVIQTFERNMQDIVSGFIENLQCFLVFARDIEHVHAERMTEVAHVTGDRLSKNELDGEMSDDLIMVFIDKDSMTSALQASHDAHMMTIDQKEDDIITRINAWMNDMMKVMHEEQEIKRNRARVIEINHIIDNLRDEIDSLEMAL